VVDALDDRDIKGVWEELIQTRYWDEVLELADGWPEKRRLIMEMDRIDKFNPDLGDLILNDPSKAIRLGEEVLANLDLPVDIDLSGAHIGIITHPFPRITSALRISDIGKLVAIRGVVSTITEVMPKITNAAFECQRCGHIFNKVQASSKFQEPYDCPNEVCDRRGPFKLLLDRSSFIDAQNVEIVEDVSEVVGSRQPAQISVQIEDDLTGRLNPGDRVIITGPLRAYQKSTQTGKSSYFDRFLDAISITVLEQDYDQISVDPDDEVRIKRLAACPEIYERLRNTVAPSIYGHEEIKDAMALLLFSGQAKRRPDGTKNRGSIHVLLLGDPGGAKSSIARYVSKTLAPRGVVVTGGGATKAGLVAAVETTSSGERLYRAGAAVLAGRGGVLNIEEMDKLGPEEQASLHDIMEEQQANRSTAAGTVTFQTECSVIATANPTAGRFNHSDTVAAQTKIKPSLMSRFDLIFVIRDVPDRVIDRAVIEKINRSNQASQILANKGTLGEGYDDISPEIDPRLIRKYVAYARQISPILTTEAAEALEEFYVSIRNDDRDHDSAVPTTARAGEAVNRLAESSARIRLSKLIEREDAVRAIDMVRSSLYQAGVDPSTGKLDADSVECGTTKTVRDRTALILSIIEEIANKPNNGGKADLLDIVAEAERHNIAPMGTKTIIERLRINGDIFEPRPNTYRTPP
jgi:replicative DNA helicase Mcm